MGNYWEIILKRLLSIVKKKKLMMVKMMGGTIWEREKGKWKKRRNEFYKYSIQLFNFIFYFILFRHVLLWRIKMEIINFSFFFFLFFSFLLLPARVTLKIGKKGKIFFCSFFRFLLLFFPYSIIIIVKNILS